MYGKEELAIIRGRKKYTKAMLDKLTKNLFTIAALMIGPGGRDRSFDDDIKNTFAFRTACSVYALTLHRTAMGGVAEMKPSRLRNDLVDMMFVAYGTFFDGVLTADTRLMDLYREVCVLLFGLCGAFVANGFDPIGHLSD
jgi:hypothetical protein